MKARRKQLELRPIVPRFLKIIPKLPAMVCKKEIIFKIFTPITCIFRGVKRMFKRKQSSRMIRHAALETKYQCLNSEEKGYQDCNVQHKKSFSLNPHSPQFIDERKIVAEMFNWQGVASCLSCQEDRPAFNTCRMCFKLYSKLPPSSCRKCLKEKPIVNLCMKYHEKQPVIYLRDEERQLAVYTSFIQELRKLQRRQMNIMCNGQTHSINNCPMCLSFWPTVGECTCPQCKRTQPVVKVFSQRSRKMMMIDICPCGMCVKTHPKIRVCSTCKSQKKGKLKTDTSFYVLLP